jgi:hypothetical protein
VFGVSQLTLLGCACSPLTEIKKYVWFRSHTVVVEMVVCSLNICLSHIRALCFLPSIMKSNVFHFGLAFVIGLVFLLAARGELPAAAVDFIAGPFCFLAGPGSQSLRI